MAAGFAAVLIIALLSGSVAYAQQSATATIEGVVTDPNNALIPGAKIAARNVDTGLTREIVTDENGIYRLTALQPGTYKLTASAQGFSENNFGSITLTVGQKLNLDLALRLNVNEVIQITDAAPVVETTRTQVSASVGEKAVRELPVNGRNFLDFVTLTPGVVRDPRQGDLSFGGQRGTFNSLQIDGVDNNNNFFGQALGRTGSGRAPYQFSQDAVQEFQVNTNAFSAEFGRAAGGAINVITKSGTNDFHGTIFEFYRDRALNANSLVSRSGGGRSFLIPSPVKPAYHFHQFGANIGGPIKKDRAFFFFNYDGQRNTQPNTVSLGVAAPTDAAAQAGLTKLLPFVKDYTRQFNQDVYLAKVDWQVDRSTRLGLRYNRQNFTGTNLENGGATNAFEHTGSSNVTTDTFTGTVNTAFTPKFLNEFRAQVGRDSEPGFANSDNAEGNIAQGGATVFVIGRNSFSPRETTEKKYQFINNASYFAGRHSFKGGADILIEKIRNFFPGNFGGRYFFDSYADFANNKATRYQQNFAGPGTTGPLTFPNYNDIGFFVQDDIRATSRLTINIGMRYDVQKMAPPRTFNADANLAAAGISTTQFNQDYNNVAPRFGFAYRPLDSERLVIRGGYGIFYGRTPSIALGTAHSNNGVNVLGFTVSNSNGVPLPFTYPNRFADLAAFRSAFATAAAATPDLFLFAKDYQQSQTQQGSFGMQIGLTRDLSLETSYLRVKGSHLSRTRDINLPVPVATTIPIQSGGSLTFLRHGGGTGTNPLAIGLRRPVTGFGRISQFESSGDSNYNALAVQLNKRFSRNFQGLLSYTWSKVIDNTPDQTSVVVGGGDDAKQAQQSFNLRDDRGVGVADVPHRLVLSGLWDLNYFSSLNGAPRVLLHGWQLSGILQSASNQPFSELLNVDLNNDGNRGPDRSPGIGRNRLRQGRFVSLDLRVTKTIGFKEDRVRLQLIGEMFNSLNRANVIGFNGQRYTVSGLNTATASLTQRTDYLDPRVAADPRIGQLALKIIF
jgi:outer membrane receptor protein involved in Fe transport